MSARVIRRALSYGRLLNTLPRAGKSRRHAHRRGDAEQRHLHRVLSPPQPRAWEAPPERFSEPALVRVIASTATPTCRAGKQRGLQESACSSPAAA